MPRNRRRARPRPPVQPDVEDLVDDGEDPPRCPDCGEPMRLVDVERRPRVYFPDHLPRLRHR